jgi:hypothetical protein
VDEEIDCLEASIDEQQKPRQMVKWWLCIMGLKNKKKPPKED